jgi:hypothetical protein
MSGELAEGMPFARLLGIETGIHDPEGGRVARVPQTQAVLPNTPE